MAEVTVEFTNQMQYQASNMTRPIVSVIIPVFNAEAFVASAIESVLAQTFTHYELILIDDGSTDETPQILKKYAIFDPRIVILKQQNAGQSVARNAGMVSAKADLVAFLDADDLATPQRLELQVDFFKAHPGLELLGGAMEEIDSQGRSFGIRYVPPRGDAAIRAALPNYCPFITSSVMARKTELLKVGGFRAQFRTSQDYDLWLRLMPYIKFENLPDILVKYRVYPSSVSRYRILDHALTPSVAQAAARLRQAGKPDPTEGVSNLTPEILQALGIDSQKAVTLQARALVSYASKMVAHGATDAACDLLQQLESLNLLPTLKSEIAPEALLIRIRILLHKKKHLAAFRLLANGFWCCPGMFHSLGGKLWRLVCRLT